MSNTLLAFVIAEVALLVLSAYKLGHANGSIEQIEWCRKVLNDTMAGKL